MIIYINQLIHNHRFFHVQIEMRVLPMWWSSLSTIQLTRLCLIILLVFGLAHNGLIADLYFSFILYDFGLLIFFIHSNPCWAKLSSDCLVYVPGAGVCGMSWRSEKESESQPERERERERDSGGIWVGADAVKSFNNLSTTPKQITCSFIIWFLCDLFCYHLFNQQPHLKRW